ncbi:P-loop containing nucleoside triphosphate hydrolase protein [Mycena filopes]|nr:P-loop containing nucleoside triphosphate hydrolase protein [Mycena filopes]
MPPPVASVDVRDSDTAPKTIADGRKRVHKRVWRGAHETWTAGWGKITRPGTWSPIAQVGAELTAGVTRNDGGALFAGVHARRLVVHAALLSAPSPMARGFIAPVPLSTFLTICSPAMHRRRLESLDNVVRIVITATIRRRHTSSRPPLTFHLFLFDPMAPKLRWRGPQGRRTVATIVKKEIPQWPNGLHPEQEDVVTRVLDGEDVICCLTTGGGKSAMFAVPIVVLREMVRNPRSYPDLPVRALPMGIVVTPTKGLAANIVHELKKLSVPALAYCHETVTEARKTGQNLVNEIQQCKTWNIVCVDPEHLREKAWRQISDSDTFRANIVFGCVDEIHLIDEWGADFRPHFRHIGQFFRGRLPSSASVLGLSATLLPGAPMTTICKSLGMSHDDFYLLRCSNERPNTQFIMEPLDHGLGGKEFPSLLRYLNSGRKAVVHVRRIDEVFRVFSYLWNALPDGPDRLRRIQMYHSLRTFEANTEILRLLDEDPRCQVVIATVAFANGINVKSLLDSISLGFPETVNQLWQEKGRVGRDANSVARGVVLFQPSALSDAQKQLAGVVLPSIPRQINPKTGKPKRTKKFKPMEEIKALMLVEKHCYIALLNRIFENPPLQLTTLDCIIAKRRLPCNLCAIRNKITLVFPPSPRPRNLILPPFTPPPTTNSAPLTATQKKLKLKKKEREIVEPVLAAFGETLRRDERKRGTNQHRPKSAFFPSSILKLLLDNLLSLTTLEDLTTLVVAWKFARAHAAALHDVVLKLQRRIESAREEAREEKNAKQRARRRSKKALRDWDSDEEEAEVEREEEEEEDAEEEEDEGEGADEESSADEISHDPPSSPIPPPSKRSKPTLVEVTNRPRPKRAPRPPTSLGDALLLIHSDAAFEKLNIAEIPELVPTGPVFLFPPVSLAQRPRALYRSFITRSSMFPSAIPPL